jgi:hypothetical protein
MFITCRALLDSASQSSFITEAMCRRLNLRTSNTSLPVSGIDGQTTKWLCKVNVSIKGSEGLVNAYDMSLDCLVLHRITEELPTFPVDVSEWNIPPALLLSYPKFHKP